jgi:Tfp pilus assembly protein PilN
MSKGINLVGSEKQISVKIGSKKIKLLRMISLSLLFGVSGLSIILFLLIALSPLPSLQKQEQSALQTLSQYHPDIAKHMLVEERLKNSEIILAKRSVFDQTLIKIKNKLPPDATITGITMNSGEISLTVTSTSLVVLDTFLNNLITAAEQKEDFSKVILSKLTTSEGGNTYSLTIKVVTL